MAARRRPECSGRTSFRDFALGLVLALSFAASGAWGQSAAQLPPASIVQLILEGQTLMALGKFDASMDRYKAAYWAVEKMREPGPRLYFRALVQLGIAGNLGGMQRYQDALKYADGAVAAISDPRIATAPLELRATIHHARGAILYSLGRRAEAQAMFQLALSEGDSDANAWLRAIAGPAARPRSATLEYGTDRPGLDIRNIALPAGTPEMCRDTCLAEPSCRAFTLVQPGIQGPDARCWLKHDVPPPKSCAWCVSGVVQ